MDAERLALEQQNRYAKEALSDGLHQVKNPLQALRTYGKLLQRRVADTEVNSAAVVTPQLLELADHLLVQSDRLADRLKPVDAIVDSLAGPEEPLALLPADEPGHLIPIPILPEQPVKPMNFENAGTAAEPSNGTRTSFEFTNVTSDVRYSDVFSSTSPAKASGDCDQVSTIEDQFSAPVLSLINSMELEIAFIGDVLEPLLSSYQMIASEHSISFEILESDELPGTTVSQEALQEVMANLIDNAFKYVTIQKDTASSWSPQESPRVRIRLQPNTSPFTPGVTILVEDNGPGIPIVDRERVFERGFRGQVSGRVEGSGIGLHIAKSLVERMGGSLRVASNDDYPGALDGTVMELVLYRNPVLD